MGGGDKGGGETREKANEREREIGGGGRERDGGGGGREMGWGAR